jgi:hypothetical protein
MFEGACARKGVEVQVLSTAPLFGASPRQAGIGGLLNAIVEKRIRRLRARDESSSNRIPKRTVSLIFRWSIQGVEDTHGCVVAQTRELSQRVLVFSTEDV